MVTDKEISNRWDDVLKFSECRKKDWSNENRYIDARDRETYRLISEESQIKFVEYKSKIEYGRG